MSTHLLSQPATDVEPFDELIRLYNELDVSQLSRLSRVYHQQLVLINPIGEYQGVDAIEHYLSNLLKRTQYCRFQIIRSLQNGNEGALFWHMDYSHPRLNKGKALQLNGSSYVRFHEQKVIYQHNYFDLGALIYEHLPLLGIGIRRVKKRLS
jgi:hypothetical protein